MELEEHGKLYGWGEVPSILIEILLTNLRPFQPSWLHYLTNPHLLHQDYFQLQIGLICLRIQLDLHSQWLVSWFHQKHLQQL